MERFWSFNPNNIWYSLVLMSHICPLQFEKNILEEFMIEANHTHAQFVTKTTESYLLKRDQILPETNQQILT